MNNNDSILEDFTKKQVVYENCENSLRNLIELILNTSDISVHSITSRTKTFNRLQEKLERKNKYESIQEITDLVGVRIVTYFEDEIDLIAKIIAVEFKIDIKNSIDKREIENDRFGYKSLHYVAQFTKERFKLLEYKPYRNLKFEIQIRSILQHGWAEIEHDIGYKGEFEIPDIAKRSFSRIAALLETADIEFVRLKEMLRNYEGTTLENIEKELDDIKIDAITLKNYISTSKLVHSQKKKFEDIVQFEEGVQYHSNTGYGKWIEKLSELGVTTIDQLNKLFEKYKEESYEYYASRNSGKKLIAFHDAVVIIHLMIYLESIKYSG